MYNTTLASTFTQFLLPCLLASTTIVTYAQQPKPNAPLKPLLSEAVITWPNGKISLQDIETDLYQAPAHERDMLRANPSAVFQIAENILIYRSLNKQAEADKFVLRPEVAVAKEIAATRAVGRLYIEHLILRDTPNESSLELAAKEQYMINPKKYKQEEELKLSHILISSAKRSKAEALTRIKEVEQLLKVNPNELPTLAAQYSDDTESARRGGSLGTIPRGKTIKAFEDAAFALKTPGEFSPIVETEYGYHLIRLDAKQIERQRSFDEVKIDMVREARAKYENDIRARIISDLRNQPGISVDDAVFTAYTGAERLKTTANPAPQGPTLTPSRQNR